ncbi:MAG: DUF5625 family protein [Gallionella sp.]|nr:DUF5625 family protein [Gallionella sp.]
MTQIRDEKFMKMRRTLMAVMALFPFLAKSAMAERLPKQPIFLPFAVAQKGSVLTFDFEAVENNLYTFLLLLKWSENDKTENARIAKFMGDGVYDPKTNKQTNTGMPIPLRLKISRLDPAGEISIYDEEIINEELQSMGPKELEKVAHRIKLPTGNYRVHVEALRDIPELAATPIQFGIYIRRL